MAPGSTQAKASSRLARIAEQWAFPLTFTLGLAFVLLSLWSPTWLPMGDVGGWIELMDVMARYHDPATIYSQIYTLPTSVEANSLAVYFGGLVGPAIDAATAAKLLVSWYALGVPLAALWMCVAFDRSRWLSLFTIPLVYNALFNVGLLNYLVAMPLLLMAIASARTLATKGRWWRGVLLALILVSLFMAHLLAFLIGWPMALATLFLSVSRPKHWLRGWSLLPALPFFVAWYERKVVHAEAAATGSTLTGEDGFGFIFQSFDERLNNFHAWGMRFFRDNTDEWCILALVLLWFVFLLARAPRTPLPGGKDGLGVLSRLLRWTQEYTLEIVALCCLPAYLLLPSHMHTEVQLIAERVVVLILLLLVLLPRVRIDSHRMRVAAALLAMVAWTYPLVVRAKFIEFEEVELGDMPRVVADLPDRTSLAYVMWENENALTYMGPLWHIPKALQAVENGGRTNDSFAIRPHCPVQIQEGHLPEPIGHQFWRSAHLSDYDYVLLRSSISPTAAFTSPRVHLMWHEGIWWLFSTGNQPQREAQSVYEGGTGGSEVALDCPDGEWLIGLRGEFDDVLTSIQPICGDPDQGTESDGPAIGENRPTGRRFREVCGPGEYVVGLHGRAALMVDQLGIICAPSGDATEGPETFSSAHGNPNGGEPFELRCPGDVAAVGFRGRAGLLPDAVGLACPGN
ncbi:MAG: hypothetical protein KC561_04635 [Myxococcales bacterium]|nr:hypothetical protein [Myxococcales bacterium]